jgi:hypothetical protein
MSYHGEGVTKNIPIMWLVAVFFFMKLLLFCLPFFVLVLLQWALSIVIMNSHMQDPGEARWIL